MAKHSDLSSSWRLPPLTNQFLRLFLPAALVLGLIVVAVRYHGDAIERGNLLSSQAYGVALAAESVNRDLETASADLQALAASRTLRSFAAQTSEPSRRAVADEFAAFVRHKQLYTDVAYIDTDSGRQLVVGRTSNGEAPTSARPVDRELVDTARSLEDPGIVVSRLNLSTEQGTVRALVHFATPVRDLDGQTRGALILTYTSTRLMAHLDETLAQRPGTDILVNRRGQWLRRSSPDSLWTVPDVGRFQQAYPQGWKTMAAADMGQFQNRNGLFTFTTIYPRSATQLRTVAATDNNDDSGESDTLPSWKIVSLVDATTLAAAAAARFWRAMLAYLVLLMPTAGGAYYAARLTKKRRDNRQRLRELGAVVEQSHDMVLITDAQGKVRYVNPRFEAITGYERDEVVGQTPAILKSGTHGKEFYRRLWDTIERGEAFQSTVTNRKKTGELFHVQMTISPLKEKDSIIGYVATGKDITGQIHTQERLLKLAFHHPLTGLPNRALFRDHLHEAAARARRGGHNVAVLFLDLDRFKKVNDSLGHQAGDELLKQVAERLRHAVREMDMVAHLGGDEFTVLLDGIQHPTQVQAIAAKLLQLFDDPFTVADRELYIGASIGIAVFPTDSDSVEKLMEQADTAMYQAKRAGRGQYQFYSAEMTTLANQRLELENRLRIALSEHQFELHFQPIVDPIRRELRGLEALIRWREPGGELIGPSEFVPVLEETGLVVPVTEWVLEEACRECRRLNDTGMSRVRMNVNISARSFYQGDLVETVRRALRRSRLAATQLVLEVTESLLLEDQRHVQKSLERLRALGVGIAIDDFGTGYSSLAYLKRLPVNIIKIDRAFIHGVGPDSRDAALVSAMMAMAQELQMDVVAEGVEEPHQLEFLRQRGCDGAQGYLFSIPLPADNIAAWLDRDARWPWKPWMDPTEATRLH